MGTIRLRRFLQSLCDNSCWNYAVFWKLQQQSQMVLMWEDVYFGGLKVQDSMNNVFAETSLGSLEETSSCNTSNGALGGVAVEQAVSYMSSFQYALGDGIVGDVAYTGNHRWVFAGSKSSDDFITTFTPEHADEWLFQFVAGVKTILLVPVTPHGVLQLGSLEDIHEDAEIANYIKHEFFAHQYFINEQLLSQSPSSPMKTLDDFPSFKSNGTRTDDPFSIHTVKWSNHNPLTRYPSHLAGSIELPEPLSPQVLMKQPLVSDFGPFLSFPKECELHKALDPAFISKPNDPLCGKDVIHSSSSNSFSQLASLEKPKHINLTSLLRNRVESTFLSRVKHTSSALATSYECVVSELTEEEGQKSNNDVPHRKSSKPSVANKRRAKQKQPRPRDRQLIQDRLKELRELVPDGAKCSIDGLLDRTVAHMLFLKSFGDRAIKLRQCVPPEASNSSTQPEDKSSQNGASWAFELGGDLNMCPIIVEDLQYPGHMTIQMICNESSRFLDIAEVIHGLHLTILKGLTERRSGNTWARFVIEAPKGFHRLDIFWPLMKLLQQQDSPSSTPLSSKI